MKQFYDFCFKDLDNKENNKKEMQMQISTDKKRILVQKNKKENLNKILEAENMMV